MASKHLPKLFSASTPRRLSSVTLQSLQRPASLKLPSSCSSLLESVKKANNVLLPQGPFKRDVDPVFRCTSGSGSESETRFDKENLVSFFPDVNGDVVGLLRPQVLETLLAEKDEELLISSSSRGVSLKSGLDYDARSAYINNLVKRWKERGLFSDILRGWSDEPFPVYENWMSTSRLAFSIERAALPLFGFPNYGCLMTGYFVCPKTSETWIWVPRRSRRKKTWPGKLDVTVGGGLGTYETPLNTIIRESIEEASFDETHVAASIKPAGLLTLHNRNPSGWLLPGVYYLFDLELPGDNSIQPKVTVSAEEGGEVESFELMSAQEVLDNIAAGEFKSSSALALVDFLIRRGLYTSETDERYVDVCMELRQRFY
ncbi:hypothetical protein K435DRAFT_852002 [Dendrothele bispora CBS 962.96]|uniref:Nudix hydrolase domain-containing protein n=1 Tax=Dendrothele bispora (strain CBS 962.96) TaxID=1314807 RepID=A0A4S8MLE9_DENBC|nr:hypothetical protein K435DRAFT_852002 [Dendrothele bispora CBS 962.96]